MVQKIFLNLLMIFWASLAFGDHPSEKLYRVTRVIDGDTIEIEGEQLVRYIGMDTPELREKKFDRWEYRPQPYAKEARALNYKLVSGQQIRLEFDVVKKDKYGRLLAYVYKDKIFINREIIRQGYAVLLTIPPNIKYVDLFKSALKQARQHRRGIWK